MIDTVSGSGSRPTFLLSPAWCGGRRAAILLREGSTLPLAVRLRAGALPLGEAFAFLSGLYFRGKLAYAQAFACGATYVITPTRGLMRPESLVGDDVLREFASVDVRADDARYRGPLERDISALAAGLGPDGRAVLFGSIATGKYVDVLTAALGARLCYPPAFIGRGDMSRGGLLLRAARNGVELEYAVLDAAAKRHGPRPPRLAPPGLRP
jgi:hypothetical protein